MAIAKTQTATIWKFPLEVTDSQMVSMPPETVILHVGVQRGTPCLWGLVTRPEDDKIQREILTIGTGHPIASGKKRYLGTYQLMDGSLVFHIFERA
jgi:hypothetical protein